MKERYSPETSHGHEINRENVILAIEITTAGPSLDEHKTQGPKQKIEIGSPVTVILANTFLLAHSYTVGSFLGTWKREGKSSRA